MLKETAKLALVLVTGVLLGLSVNGWSAPPADQQSDQPTRPAAEATASTMIDLGDRIVTCEEGEVAAETTAWDLLRACAAERELELATEDYGEMGLLITAIGGRENGRGDRYWQYWVNNQYANIGSQDRQISAGDVILWNYTSSKQ